MALWPDVSGNAINGLDDAAVDRPRPIYWHTQVQPPHAHLQQWFYAQSRDNERLAEMLRIEIRLEDMWLQH